jgi:hypothetical protein
MTGKKLILSSIVIALLTFFLHDAPFNASQTEEPESLKCEVRVTVTTDVLYVNNACTLDTQAKQQSVNWYDWFFNNNQASQLHFLDLFELLSSSSGYPTTH